MLHMRYGAVTPSAEADGVYSWREVSFKKKLGEMRKTGLRLNLGCGHVQIEGFPNIDGRKLPGVNREPPSLTLLKGCEP